MLEGSPWKNELLLQVTNVVTMAGSRFMAEAVHAMQAAVAIGCALLCPATVRH